MEHDMMVFESLMKSEGLARSTFILYFTKADIFNHKIEAATDSRVQLTMQGHLPDYERKPTDVGALRDFIMKKFRDLYHQDTDLPICYLDVTKAEDVLKLLGIVED